MGLTYWKGDERMGTRLVKPRGNKGAYYVGKTVVDSKLEAVKLILRGTQYCIMERGMGNRATVVNAQAKLRGYIEAVADSLGVPTREIKPAEWRRPIKEHLGISWPAKSEDMKRLAQQVVKELYGIEVTEDEADSVCIGWAALRYGYVPTK